MTFQSNEACFLYKSNGPGGKSALRSSSSSELDRVGLSDSGKFNTLEPIPGMLTSVWSCTLNSQVPVEVWNEHLLMKQYYFVCHINNRSLLVTKHLPDVLWSSVTAVVTVGTNYYSNNAYPSSISWLQTTWNPLLLWRADEIDSETQGFKRVRCFAVKMLKSLIGQNWYARNCCFGKAVDFHVWYKEHKKSAPGASCNSEINRTLDIHGNIDVRTVQTVHPPNDCVRLGLWYSNGLTWNVAENSTEIQCDIGTVTRALLLFSKRHKIAWHQMFHFTFEIYSIGA